MKKFTEKDIEKMVWIYKNRRVHGIDGFSFDKDFEVRVKEVYGDDLMITLVLGDTKGNTVGRSSFFSYDYLEDFSIDQFKIGMGGYEMLIERHSYKGHKGMYFVVED